MTYDQFVTICEEYTILPDVALENEIIAQACQDGATAQTIKMLLEEEF